MINKNKTNNKWFTKYTLIAPLFIIIMVCFVLKIKNIYPFGNNSICYSDFIQCYGINYKYFLDCVKNLDFSKLFYADTLYGGTGIFATMSVTGIFSIFSAFYLLCTNSDNILYFMSYAFIIKVIIASITMYYSLKRLFTKNNEFINVVLSIIWGLSSYILLNYTTIIWLDVMILFPIFVVAFKNILDNKNITMYAITLALITITSFQLAFIILIFIITASAFAFRYNINREDRKVIILKLGIASFIGLLVSSVFLLPTIHIYMQSHRSSISTAIQSYNGAFYIKLLHLILYSFICYGTLSCLKYIKEDKIIKGLFASFAFVAVIPLIFEGFNQVWHGGGYFCFPFREGFIATYLMLLLTGYYYNKYFSLEKKFVSIKTKVVAIISIVVLFLASIYFNYLFVNESINIRLVYQGMTGLIALYTILYVVTRMIIYYLAGKIGSIFLKIIIVIVTIIEIFYACYSMIGKVTINSREFSKFFTEIKIGEEINSKNYNNSSDTKFLDYDNDFYTNAGLYTGLNINAGWILFDESTSNMHDYLYNDADHTKISSTNGLALSDYLLNVGYVISEEKLSDVLFTRVALLTDNKILYKYNYDINHAFKYNSNKDIFKLPEKATLANTYNYIFNNIFGEGDIVQVVNGEKKSNSDGIKTTLEFDLNIIGNKVVCYDFLHRAKVVGIKILKIDNNGNTIDEKEYAIGKESKIALGYYSNEHIKVQLDVLTYSSDISDAQIEIFDIDKFLNCVNSEKNEKVDFYKNENSYNYTVNSNGNENLLIPMHYSKNWTITNNGKKIDYDRALEGLISVKLEEGENKIELKYFDPWIIYGLIITVIGLVLLLLYIKYKEVLLKNESIQKIVYILFFVALFAVLFFMSIYGIALTVLDFVNNVT